MAEKRNIFLIGPMGAGKSTIGKFLSEMLHMDLYDSDRITSYNVCYTKLLRIVFFIFYLLVLFVNLI